MGKSYLYFKWIKYIRVKFTIDMFGLTRGKSYNVMEYILKIGYIVVISMCTPRYGLIFTMKCLNQREWYIDVHHQLIDSKYRITEDRRPTEAMYCLCRGQGRASKGSDTLTTII